MCQDSGFSPPPPPFFPNGIPPTLAGGTRAYGGGEEEEQEKEEEEEHPYPKRGEGGTHTPTHRQPQGDTHTRGETRFCMGKPLSGE